MVTSKQNSSVTTTEILLHTATGKSKLTIKSTSGLDIYVGPTGVTPSNGFKIEANTPCPGYTFKLSDGDSLYGITAASTGSVQILITT